MTETTMANAGRKRDGVVEDRAEIEGNSTNAETVRLSVPPAATTAVEKNDKNGTADSGKNPLNPETGNGDIGGVGGGVVANTGDATNTGGLERILVNLGLLQRTVIETCGDSVESMLNLLICLTPNSEDGLREQTIYSLIDVFHHWKTMVRRNYGAPKETKETDDDATNTTTSVRPRGPSLLSALERSITTVVPKMSLFSAEAPASGLLFDRRNSKRM
jgi:hypothetical protein